jgi:hypothetical protein
MDLGQLVRERGLAGTRVADVAMRMGEPALDTYKKGPFSVVRAE